MGEVAGTDHGAEDGGGVESVAGLGGGHGEEAETVGVEAVELALMAEARDDGLRAREGGESVLVRELRDQATETGGVGEVGGVGIGVPGFFGFSFTQEREKLLVAGFGGGGGGALEG